MGVVFFFFLIASNHHCIDRSQCNTDKLLVRFVIGQENVRDAPCVNKRNGGSCHLCQLKGQL